MYICFFCAHIKQAVSQAIMRFLADSDAWLCVAVCVHVCAYIAVYMCVSVCVCALLWYPVIFFVRNTIQSHVNYVKTLSVWTECWNLKTKELLHNFSTASPSSLWWGVGESHTETGQKQEVYLHAMERLCSGEKDWSLAVWLLTYPNPKESRHWTHFSYKQAEEQLG